MSIENTFLFSQESSLHIYRTEIPNVLLEMGLDPYELSVYIHIKRTAGDSGKCFKTLDILCQEIKISRTKLIEVKEALKNRGLIRIEKRFNSDKSRLPDLITVIDLWHYNASIMLNRYQKEGGSSPHEPPLVRHTNHPSSPHEPKEEHKQEEHKQQQANAAAFPKKQKKQQQQIYPCLSELKMTDEEKHLISKSYDEQTVNDAAAFVLDKIKKGKAPDSIPAQMMWACRTKQKAPPSLEDVTAKHKACAQKIAAALIAPKNARFDILSDHVEIVFTEGQKQPECVEFKRPDFFETVRQLLIKYKFERK